MPDPIDQAGATLHAFLDQVMQKAPQVDSVGEADRLTRGVLATLAQVVSAGELADLATALPPDLRTELTDAGQPRALDRAGFLDRISGHSSTVDSDIVEQQGRAVLTTLADWSPPNEVDDLRSQLPAELRDLFGQEHAP